MENLVDFYIQDGDRIVIINMPWLYHGTFFAPNEYKSYVLWKYGKKVDIAYINRDPKTFPIQDNQKVFIWENDILIKGNQK